jgi:hypothetical protein
MGTTKSSAAKAVKPAKFQVIMSASGQDVLDTRASIAFESANNAMVDKLRALKSRKNDLKLQELNLTDLSVETKDSLRPGEKNFNPKAWIDQLCAIRMEIALLEDEISIAELVAEEFFSTEEVTE